MHFHDLETSWPQRIKLSTSSRSGNCFQFLSYWPPLIWLNREQSIVHFCNFFFLNWVCRIEKQPNKNCGHCFFWFCVSAKKTPSAAQGLLHSRLEIFFFLFFFQLLLSFCKSFPVPHSIHLQKNGEEGTKGRSRSFRLMSKQQHSCLEGLDTALNLSLVYSALEMGLVAEKCVRVSHNHFSKERFSTFILLCCQTLKEGQGRAQSCDPWEATEFPEHFQRAPFHPPAMDWQWETSHREMLTMYSTLFWVKPFLSDINIYLYFRGQNITFVIKGKRSRFCSCCHPLVVLSREFLQNLFLQNSNSACFGFASVCLPRQTREEIFRSSITLQPTEGFMNAQCQHFRIYTTYIPLNSIIWTTTLALMRHGNL